MSSEIERIKAYIERRKKCHSLDIEHVHGFDLGPNEGTELLLSDIESLVINAARYKWLRDGARESACEICPIVVMMDEGGAVIGDQIDCHGIRAEGFLDAAVDFAMARGKK